MSSVGEFSARELEAATSDVRARWRSAIRENRPPEKVEELASLLGRLSNELRRRGSESKQREAQRQSLREVNRQL